MYLVQMTLWDGFQAILGPFFRLKKSYRIATQDPNTGRMEIYRVVRKGQDH